MNKLEQIETMLQKLTENRDDPDTEKLLDNGDLTALFGITKRTLQRYRQKSVIPYYMVRGKPYYKAGEVRECLKKVIKENQNFKK